MQLLTGVAMVMIYLYLFMLTTWVLFLAAMNLKGNLTKITPVAKLFAYPTAIVAWLWDCAFNIFAGTLLFLELPHELVFTSRCERHMKEKGWRGQEARFWCRNLLDPFDPGGKHCQ